MKVFRCRIVLQDFLFFASRDLAKIGVTEKVIHNTALNYAINYTSRILNYSTRPMYDTDIPAFPLRATPARPANSISETAFSYNAINDKDQSTEISGNYPTVGKYYKFDFGYVGLVRGMQKFSFSAFECFVFSFNDQVPRRIIKLGKKESYCIVDAEELQSVRLREATKENPVTPDHPINPLELDGKLSVHFPFYIKSLPPSLLILTGRFEGKHLVGKDKKGDTVTVFPPKDKIKEFVDYYESN